MNGVHIRGKANMPWNILIDTHRHFRTDFGISRCVGFVGTLKVFFVMQILISVLRAGW